MIVRLSKRYAFPAAHRLHSPMLSIEENRATYGKCNNPLGHGHNYEVELTLRGEVDAVTGRVVDLNALDALAEKAVLVPLRYRNLNEEVPLFRSIVPTTENLGREVDRRLRLAWAEAFTGKSLILEKVRIWETDRNICEITEGA